MSANRPKSAAESDDSLSDDVEMIEGVLRLSELHANDEMTPRVDIEGYDLDLPEELADIPVPAFMIQPIVENGVRHARHDDGSLNIHISVRAEGNDLYIVIADDGVGMSEEKRKNIMHAKSTSGLGIAVRNINDRVTGYFAPGSNMSYESKLGKGTTVTLYLKDALILNKDKVLGD